VVFDGPYDMPRDTDAEALRAMLQERMNAAQARAEAMVGLEPTPAPTHQAPA
jgi:hypothetical protein